MRAQYFRRLVALLLGVGVLSSFSSAQDASRQPGKKYALLVAVRKYDPTELRNLPYAESDITDLARVLREKGYRREHVVVMSQTVAAEEPRFAPESARIRKELNSLLKLCEERDTLLVAFAGHGVQFKNSEEVYFCPADARLSDKQTLVSLTEVYQSLNECEAGFKLLLVDACRNDPQSDNSRARSEVKLESVTRPQKRQPPGGTAAFFSCSAGEKAFEHSDLKHGVFFHYVIEGLKGAAADKGGRVTLPDLEKYVKEEVKTFVYAKYGVPQRPEILNKTRELVSLVSPSPSAFAGKWIGTWENSLGQKGKDALTLEESANGVLTGTWIGTIPVKGSRRKANEIYFEGESEGRFYRAVGRIIDGQLVIDYTTSNAAEQRTASGKSRLKRAESR